MNGRLLTLGAIVLSAVAGYYATQWAIPSVIMSAAVDRTAARTGVNTMAHNTLATPENQPIVRPSPDLAYSVCPFDLSTGPVRVHVEPVAGRYSSLSVFDAKTDVAFVRNDIQAGGKPYEIVLARKGQTTPPGSEVVTLDHDRGLALIRLLLADPKELESLQTQRAKTWCKAVSAG